MSIQIPLISDGNLIDNLGSEFNKIQNSGRDRGLMDPTVRGEKINNRNMVTEIDFDGVQDVNILLENNYDPESQLIKSDIEQIQYITHLLENKKMTVEERYAKQFSNNEIDPRLLRELKEQDREDPESNMMSLESQDYVKEVQKSIQSYETESNLYFLDPKRSKQKGSSKLDLTEQLFKDIVEGKSAKKTASNVIENLKKDEERKAKETLSRREKIIGKQKPAMREKIIPKPERTFLEKTRDFFTPRFGHDEL